MKNRWAFLCVLCFVALYVAPGASPDTAARRARYVFPLKVSANRRYLVDQRGRPFLIAGDSPQAMIGNLSLKQAAFYLADRHRAGFDTVLVDLLCNTYTGCRSDGTTYDGIEPFRTPGDLSTPNPAYFARADAMIRLAAHYGMVVFLDPIETGGWLDVLRQNGVAKDRAYGRWVGRRYKRFANVLWWNGNDFQSWQNPADDAVVLAVAKGIRETDPQALQTVELNYWRSGSLDDQRWRSVIRIDGAYTYYATYAQVSQEYERKRFMPVVMQEAGYEFDQLSDFISPGTPPVLRREEYWSALSGAAGQLYGNHYTWPFLSGWQTHLDTVGSRQFGYLVRVLEGLRWYRLVPDIHHRLVTAGYGIYDESSNVASSDYVTAAATPDGKLALAYLPVGGTVSVDLARFRGRVRVRWFDPTTGRFQLSGSLLRNAGVVQLSAPGTSHDWLLVLSTSR